MEKTFTISMEYDKAPATSEGGGSLMTEDPTKQDLSVNIRKITNGWLVCRSWYEGDCEDRCYKSDETYYDHNPIQ